jgi:predicted nucleic acid-binding protein
LILIDTSAWIEFLRGTDSEVSMRVDQLLESRTATTDPVIMEVLAGARNELDLRRLQALLGRSRNIACSPADFLAASEIRRATRAAGESVRGTLDCLIAAIAIRENVPVLHSDRDFEVIARHSNLSLVKP